MEDNNYNSGGMNEFIDKIRAFINSTRDRTIEFDHNDIEQNKVVSGLAYLPMLFFLPLVACPRSTYGRFHANQSLTLLICLVVLWIASAMLFFVPFIAGLLHNVLQLVWVFYIILGMVNGFQGRAKELPFIGRAKILN